MPKASAKSDQLAAARVAKATKSGSKASTRKASTKKATAKASAKKGTTKRSTAKRVGTTGPRTKGARFHLRQVLKDATSKGVIKSYTMRGLGDGDVPSTIVLKDGTKAFPKDPAEALTLLKGKGYSPDGDGKAADAVAALSA